MVFVKRKASHIATLHPTHPPKSHAMVTKLIDLEIQLLSKMAICGPQENDNKSKVYCDVPPLWFF